jgi:hypothetical protein
MVVFDYFLLKYLIRPRQVVLAAFLSLWVCGAPVLAGKIGRFNVPAQSGQGYRLYNVCPAGSSFDVKSAKLRSNAVMVEGLCQGKVQRSKKISLFVPRAWRNRTGRASPFSSADAAGDQLISGNWSRPSSFKARSIIFRKAAKCYGIDLDQINRSPTNEEAEAPSIVDQPTQIFADDECQRILFSASGKLVLIFARSFEGLTMGNLKVARTQGE